MGSTHTHETNVNMTEASIFTFIKSLILNILHKASEGNFFLCLCTTCYMEHYFYKLCGAPIPARGWYSAGQETPCFM